MDILPLIQAVPGVGPYLPEILMVFGISAVLAAQLPPPKTTASVYGVLYQVVNLLAHNYNQASNALAPVTKTPTTTPTAVLALLAALALACGLGACSGAGRNPAADVAALEAGLTAAEAVATSYIQLPPCSGTNRPLCSDGATVGQIKAADMQAYTLVKAAEQAIGDPSALSAAQAAVAALTRIIDSLPKRGS